MKLQELLWWHALREDDSIRKDMQIASQVLNEYICYPSQLQKLISRTNPMETLLYNYFLLTGKDRKILCNIMEKYNFHYSTAFHSVIYSLLGKKDEVACENFMNPLYWPGILSIHKDMCKYIIETIKGTIEVYKASGYLNETSSKYIFDKPLTGFCYDRTYDFIKENRDYEAVLSYLPTYFGSGHYHAYVQKGDIILDIASNGYYLSKQYSEKVLYGCILKRLTYEKFKEAYHHLLERIPELKQVEHTKLHVLSLYYDYQKQKNGQ